MVINIYHPPQHTQQGITNSVCITEFTEFITEATSKHNNILILGDFNIHINDLEGTDSCLLLDTIGAFNLKWVDIPMHNLCHTLNLIIMENSEEYQVEKIIPGPYNNRSHLKTQQFTHSRGLQHSHQWPRGHRLMSPTWHHRCLQSQMSRYTNGQSVPHPQSHHHGKFWRIPSGKDHTWPLHIRPSVYNNAINWVQTQSTTTTHQAQENTRWYSTRIW